VTAIAMFRSVDYSVVVSQEDSCLSDDTIASCLSKLEEMLAISILSLITLVTLKQPLLTTQLCNNRLYIQYQDILPILLL
jgi:hypothetical protein